MIAAGVSFIWQWYRKIKSASCFDTHQNLFHLSTATMHMNFPYDCGGKFLSNFTCLISMQDALNNLRQKLSKQERQYAEENQSLVDEYKRITEQHKQLHKKMK